LSESWLSVPITDLQAQYYTIADKISAAVNDVLRRGQFIMGPEVVTLERAIAVYCGTRYAVGVASGTDALRLTLKACDIGPGDEVITTPFSFVATIEAIVHCGATPVFVDIDPCTCNMNVAMIEEKITAKTKAILPVHLYGQAVDMDSVKKLALCYGLLIIEDCAQAMGAEYGGRRVGSLGDVGCLSFFPSKNLGAYGDGGMVITDNKAIAEAVSVLRKHGVSGSNCYAVPGYNSRLDTLQAAVLLVKLRHLDTWIDLRRQKAGLYNGLFNVIDGITPACAGEFSKHSYNYYTVHVETDALIRDELRAYLAARGIQTAVYYPLALHLQEAYLYLGYSEGDFPVAEKAQTQVLSLPMYPELSEQQIEYVVDGVSRYIESRQFEPVT
jgi:dTDP-4-amino-4,6-dideoxygalactose transaminase